jgi:hypothetical protein
MALDMPAPEWRRLNGHKRYLRITQNTIEKLNISWISQGIPREFACYAGNNRQKTFMTFYKAL